jgi:hypothetical protein
LNEFGHELYQRLSLLEEEEEKEYHRGLELNILGGLGEEGGNGLPSSRPPPQQQQQQQQQWQQQKEEEDREDYSHQQIQVNNNNNNNDINYNNDKEKHDVLVASPAGTDMQHAQHAVVVTHHLANPSPLAAAPVATSSKGKVDDGTVGVGVGVGVEKGNGGGVAEKGKKTTTTIRSRSSSRISTKSNRGKSVMRKKKPVAGRWGGRRPAQRVQLQLGEKATSG